MEPSAMEPNQGEVTRRPVAITIICVIGFLGTAFVVPLIFSDVAARVGAWYPPFLAASTAVGFVCMIGLWTMRRWAVYLYTALTAVGQVLVIWMGLWNLLSLLIPAIVIAIGFANLSKMR